MKILCSFQKTELLESAQNVRFKEHFEIRSDFMFFCFPVSDPPTIMRFPAANRARYQNALKFRVLSRFDNFYDLLK